VRAHDPQGGLAGWHLQVCYRAVCVRVCCVSTSEGGRQQSACA
jgi:hypothetical protein